MILRLLAEPLELDQHTAAARLPCERIRETVTRLPFDLPEQKPVRPRVLIAALVFYQSFRLSFRHDSAFVNDVIAAPARANAADSFFSFSTKTKKYE